MFRKTVWKNSVSDAVSWHQDQALNTTIFILKHYGPTGFQLQEEGESKNFKVCLGDPHSCTCSTFLKERDLCKHICWVLMRKFRLPREHEYSFQEGLVERQILEVLQGLQQSTTTRPENTTTTPENTSSSPEDGNVRQRDIQAGDVCPICQEELLDKRLPVSYCRFGCGNNVHISCVNVWADHQSRSSVGGDVVKCPLCREDFGPLTLVREQARNAAKLCTAAERERPDRHLGVPCNNCGACPITGECFKCTACRYYHLCRDCMRTSRHPHHKFAVRMTRAQKWRPVEQLIHTLGEPRETTAEKDSSPAAVDSDGVPERVVRSFPLVRVRTGGRLLDPGQQCRLCLRSFSLHQYVRTLPCRHKFHMDCVDGFLRRSNSCPLDGSAIFNPLLWGVKGLPKPASSTPPHPQAKHMGSAHKGARPRLSPSLGVAGSEGLQAGALLPLSSDPVVMGVQGLSIASWNTEGQQRDVRGEGQQRDVRGEGQQRDVRGEGQQREVRGEGGALVKPAAGRTSRFSDQLGREDSSREGLPRIKSCPRSDTLTRHGAATSQDRLGAASAGGVAAHRGLSVGFNMSQADRTGAARPTGLRKTRPQRALRASAPLPRTDTGTPGLSMTGVLLSTQCQQKSQ